MGKGMRPKKGYNDKKYKDNYDSIDWSSVRKNSKGLMGSSTKVHKDKRQKEIDPITKIPKICTGTNTEKRRAEKPTTTESPLNSIPLPEIRNVFEIA